MNINQLNLIPAVKRLFNSVINQISSVLIQFSSTTVWSSSVILIIMSFPVWNVRVCVNELFLFQGNDQIRFELTCYALYPQVQVSSHDPSASEIISCPSVSDLPSFLNIRSSLPGGFLSFTTASVAGRTWWSTQRWGLSIHHFTRSVAHSSDARLIKIS